MKCPHCTVNFHDQWTTEEFKRYDTTTGWGYNTAICPECKEAIIEIGRIDPVTKARGGIKLFDIQQVYPLGSSRGPVSPQVPAHIAEDYAEAAKVLPISPKASAALARRCLQAVLHDNNYKDRDLAREIDKLLNESDSSKAVPSSLRITIDAIRNFGNFSAHPITDVTSLQVIPVEDHEAEWCLDVLDELFAHFYVRPAEAAARKAALNAKLLAGNKPPAK